MPDPDPIVEDLRRELRKAQQALAACARHLSAQAEANAALHMAEIVPTPLLAAVQRTMIYLDGTLRRTEP